MIYGLSYLIVNRLGIKGGWCTNYDFAIKRYAGDEV